MKVLLVHPGASWSTADVEAGLRYGLEHHGIQVVRYHLNNMIVKSTRWMMSSWRAARKNNSKIKRPTPADIFYHAGVSALERALRHEVDVVLVVSAMYLHPDVVHMMRRAGLKVCVLFTESPYDIDKELPFAEIVDGGWTMERSVVEEFRKVNPNMGYIPHGWHPERHHPDIEVGKDVASHDVVFVGTAFRERNDWLRAINWDGIDMALYGSWEALGSRSKLRKHVRGRQVNNDVAAQLYKNAKIGINLYRKSKGWGRKAPFIEGAESMNPRGYELAACGAFHISEYRDEVTETMGDLVPTFTSPQEAERLIREWLPQEQRRREIARQLPACVAESSWVERATRVIGDLQVLLGDAPPALIERTG